jgi:hypothetical protein
MPAGQNHSNFALNTRLSAPRCDTWCKIQVLTFSDGSKAVYGLKSFRKEKIMKKQLINYETMLKVTKAISHSKDPEEVALMTVESIKTALDRVV